MKTITYNPETHKLVPIDSESIKEAVFSVIDGFTLPHDVRKILETAYYAAPAAEETTLASRPWVGLTDNEWQDISDKYGMIIYGSLKRQIEDKLREKNAPAASDSVEEIECPECGGNGAGGAHEDDCSKAEEAPQQEPKKDLMWSTVAMQERHDQRIENIVATLDRIKQEQQPATHGEPVAWQRRLRLREVVRTFPQQSAWTDWTPCTAEAAKEFAAAKDEQWEYEVRPLYTSPRPTPMELRSGELSTALVQAAKQALKVFQMYELPILELGMNFVHGYESITALQNALMSVPDGKGTT